MVSEQKILVRILGCILFLSMFCEAQRSSTCIKYETYTITEYNRYPFAYHSHWLSHRMHGLPQRTSRIGFRTRLGICCNLGYQYSAALSTCMPQCYIPCKPNSHCSAPNTCICDEGFKVSNDFGMLNPCVPIGITAPASVRTPTTIATTPTTPTKTTTTTTPTTTTITTTRTTTTTSTTPTTTTITTTPTTTQTTTPTTVLMTTTTEHVSSSTPQSCIDSCATNELCSGDTCICKEGFQISVQKGSAKCEPKCEPACHNADCIKPNVCACWLNYQRMNDTSCHQPCSNLTCKFGECNEHGTCVCPQGFRNNGTSCIWAEDGIISNSESTTDGTVRTTFDNQRDQKITEKLATDESTEKMTFLIVGFVAFILLVGVLTFIWLKFRHYFRSPASYNHMEEGGQESGGL